MKRISGCFLLTICLLLAGNYNTFGTTLEKATLAGGCFWCMEPPYEKLEGIKDVVSGYTGGLNENPTYEEVSSGITDHFEAVQIIYDPDRISFERLLHVFWKQIDPTDPDGQFVDRGSQYRTAIFYHSEEQKILAEKSLKEMDMSGRYEKPVVTLIRPAEKFYRAEEYHQDYYKKNPVRYKVYRYFSGRDKYLDRVWGDEKGVIKPEETGKKYSKPSKEKLKKMLTPLQYRVTQEDATERAFNNDYWDNNETGIYVDIVSGEPLFSSIDKFKSGTGWPSFSRPVEPDNIVEKKDRSFFVSRTEVRSRHADSHLGHLFNDGPEPTGLRYCINSASLRFILKEDLEKEGYGEYRSFFEK